jgi:DNA helicase-2/ATP-dependent DNA helicase PcrA
MPVLIETQTDRDIRQCLDDKRSFAVIAGAGSGKTTALVTALDYLRTQHGNRLRRDGQSIACITYTNRAVDVISSRLGWDDLFIVSTLHSFLWNAVGNFTPNIRASLREHVIPAIIEKKRQDDNGGQSQKAVKARQRIAELQEALGALDDVPRFIYSNNVYSNYQKGELSHDDVIAVAAHLIRNNSRLQRILGQRFPYIFIDEAQDTFREVVEALNLLCGAEGLPLVGYFGDPVQQIYEERAGDFQGPQGAEQIAKTENYRCSRSVIRFLNVFRNDLTQIAAGGNRDIDGSVQIHLITAEEPQGPRRRYTDEQVARAIDKFDTAIQNCGWADNPDSKQLFLARQMIARRLGFTGLHQLFTGVYASTKAQEEYESGAHYLLAPFVDQLCPLIKSYRADDMKAVISLLSGSSIAFDPLGQNTGKSLGQMREHARVLLGDFSEMWDTATVRELLVYAKDHGLFKASVRLQEELHRPRRNDEYDKDAHELDKGDWLADTFFNTHTQELDAYVDFVSENTPFSTQHGVKGEEYKDVLVVFDDVEAAWNQYSFTKLLAPGVHGDPTEGQSRRSYRLAYVSFSRAIENLKVFLFTLNPERVRNEILDNGLCTDEQIIVAE